MNPVTEALLAGYAARQLLGEAVTFRGEVLSVPQINRAPGRRERNRYNFEEDTQSIVELPPTGLDEPLAGDVLLDQFSRYHRIRETHFDGICWVCGCTVSAAAT